MCTLTNQIIVTTFAQQMPFEQSEWYTISQNMLYGHCTIMVEFAALHLVNCNENLAVTYPPVFA